MRELINVCFNEEVKSIFPKREIQNFLINHERKELFIDNLIGELKGAQHALKKKDLKPVITDMVRMFCKAAIAKKADEVVSSAERTKRIRQREIEIDENTQGGQYELDDVVEYDRSVTLGKN